MPYDDTPVNTIAPLANVALCAEAVDRILNRTPGLPGLANLFGPSGYGKSFAAIYAANKYRAYLVRVQSTWTRKVLCEAIAQELGLPIENTIAKNVKAIIQQLAGSRRPLIIDEADYLMQGRMLDIIRDIHDLGHVAILMLGEEMFPTKLKRSERVDGRVLVNTPAQPVSMADTGHLVRMHCRGIDVAADLQQAIHTAARGSVRRVVVNLDEVRHVASIEGRVAADLAWWGDRPFFTGAPPAPRKG